MYRSTARAALQAVTRPRPDSKEVKHVTKLMEIPTDVGAVLLCYQGCCTS
jgi:hypothetical protein